MKKRVLIPLAHEIEEMETIIVSDLLTLAGAEIIFASVEETLEVTAARGAKLVASQKIEDCADDQFDLIFCAGGMTGAEHLRDSKILIQLLKAQKNSGRWFSAICASPSVVLAQNGLLEGYKATCYPAPALIARLPDQSEVKKSVVVDRNCITSQAPGTTILLALKLVESLFDKKTADQIAKNTLIQ